LFSTVDSALKAMKRGHPIVVSDSEARENEGDFILPAAAATAEVIGFINRYSSGVICAPMHQRRADALDLPPMVSMNTDPKRTAFTVSVDAVDGTTTGISAGDRAATLRALADPCASPGWFSRPGHIFPLVGRSGGVFERDGHTEATLDLCALAGTGDTGMLVEVMNDDGTMARRDELARFSRAHALEFITIDALKAYRLRNEQLVHVKEEKKILRPDGTWHRVDMQSVPGLPQITVLIRGQIENGSDVRFCNMDHSLQLPGFEEKDCQIELASNIRELRYHKSAVLIVVHEGTKDIDSSVEIQMALGVSALRLLSPSLSAITLTQDAQLRQAATFDIECLTRSSTLPTAFLQEIAVPW
tara:strand:+ start:2267 stop:3343 length:1077 start_codon:yes stop_codon:yes gene_type:complete